MNKLRRTLLKATALLSSIIAVRGTAAAALPAQQLQPALDAFLDTLLPPVHGPGATDLNLGPVLIEASRQIPGYAEFLEQGMRWLDDAAKALGANDFAALSEDQRVALVMACEKAPPDALERKLFDQLRHDAFTLFYSDPRSWAALDYDGPPQPAGFVDFAEPPARDEL